VSPGLDLLSRLSGLEALLDCQNETCHLCG